jgi:hypothetical protein
VLLRHCWYAAWLAFGVPTIEVSKVSVVGKLCFMSAPHTNNGAKAAVSRRILEN